MDVLTRWSTTLDGTAWGRPTLGDGLQKLIDDGRVRSGANLVAGGLLFYFVQQWLWPAPLGVLVQGMVIGGLTALIAFGLALIYRSNRIINFAQGDLGGVPASLAVLLIAGPGIPYFLAVPIGLVAAAAGGGTDPSERSTAPRGPGSTASPTRMMATVMATGR